MTLITGAWALSASAQEDITSQYLTNADLSTVDTGWTYYSDSYKYQGWRNHNTETVTPCVEFYAGWGSLEHTDFKFSQSVTLPAGDYRIAVNAFFRNTNDGDGTNPNRAWIFAGTKTQNVVGLTNGGLSAWSSAGDDMDKAAAAFKSGAFSNAFDFTLTEEQTIEIGFQGRFAAIRQWCILGPVKLYKYSLENYLVDYRAKVAEAEALYSSPMNSTVLSELQAAVVEESTLSTSADVANAISTLTEKIAAANTSVANYANAKAWLIDKAATFDADGQAAFAANTTIAPLLAAYNDRSLASLSAADQSNVVSALQVAAKAQTTPGADMTFAIVNPTIEDITGWTVSRPLGGNGPLLNGTAMEYWAGNASDRSNASFDYYQTITGLPNGTYTVSAEMYNSLNNEGGDYTVFSPTSGVYGTSNDTQSALVDVDGTTLTRYTTPEITVLNGTLRIGVKNVTTPMAARWFVADNFQLTYVGPIADLTPYVETYEAALAAAKATAGTTERIAPSVLSALNSTITTYDEGQVDETSQSALEAATAALVAANEKGQTSIASYAVIAQGFVPDNSLEGWTCETFVAGQDVRFQVNTWSGEGNNDGSNMVTPFIENWTPGGKLLGEGKVYYRLEGLEPGEVYRVEALVRSYNEASADAPNGPNFYVNGDVADLTEVGTTFTYNNMSGIYGTQVAAATIGSDGVLELGIVVASNRNYNWVAFKNIKISTYDAALNEAVAAVQALNGKVPAATYTNVAQAAIDACQGENYPTTADGFESAIESLNAAVESLQSMVTAYTGFLELKAIAEYNRDAESDAEDTAKQDFATAITTAQTSADAATTAAEVEAANAQLKTDMNTYVNGCNPVNNGQFDLTYMLVNPELSAYAAWTPGIPGWYTDQEGGNFQAMVNAELGPGDEHFMEYWSDQPKTSGFVLYQKATLPAGTYKMTGRVGLLQNVGGTTANMTFSANETDGTQIAVGPLADQSVEFVNTTEQEVKIGLKAQTGNCYRWIGINDIKMYKVPAKSYTVGDGEWVYTQEGAGDVTLNRSIQNGWNAYILPFNMTQAEVETYFGEGAQVKLVKEYIAETEKLKFETIDGLRANVPCLIKATTAAAAGTVIPARTIIPASATEVVYEGTNVTMTGCYASQTNVPANGIFVQGAKLVYNSGADGFNFVYSTRAYITLNGWTPDPDAGIKGLNIDFGDDEATGIATIENGELKIYTGKAYDLSGREVKNPTKGLYIIDGKKVFLK